MHTKPKQAMLFRMSAETFEQLEDAQNLPKLHFEFGKTPVRRPHLQTTYVQL